LASVGGDTAASQLATAATLVLVTGLLLLACGLLRLGFLADLIGGCWALTLDETALRVGAFIVDDSRWPTS
jgi:hypothetical protein